METYEFTKWGLTALITLFTLGFGILVLLMAHQSTKHARKLKEQMDLVEIGNLGKLLDRLSTDAETQLISSAWRYGMHIFVSRASSHEVFYRAWRDQFNHPAMRNDDFLSLLFIERWNKISSEELSRHISNNDFDLSLRMCGEVHHDNPSLPKAFEFLLAAARTFENFEIIVKHASRSGLYAEFKDRAIRGAIATARLEQDRERMLRDHLIKDPMKYAELWLPFTEKETSKYRLGLIVAFTPEESPASELALAKLHESRVPATV